MGLSEKMRTFSNLSHRAIISTSSSKLFPLVEMLNTLRGLTMRSLDEESLFWWQKRSISSGLSHSFPRKNELFSSRLHDFEENKTVPKKTARRLPPAQRLPEPEYRKLIVENSTKAMALVPKKWKRALPCKEVVNAVIYLRKAKRNPDAVKQVLRKRISRLLKLELMLVLSELQQLDEWVLARQVFNTIRKESWYKPNVYLYQTMVQLFGKNKQINEAENMLNEMQEEGLTPDGSIRRELLRAYTISNMVPEAVKLYKDIQAAEVDQNAGLDRAARSILFHCLKAEEKKELAEYEKEKGYNWSCE